MNVKAAVLTAVVWLSVVGLGLAIVFSPRLVVSGALAVGILLLMILFLAGLLFITYSEIKDWLDKS